MSRHHYHNIRNETKQHLLEVETLIESKEAAKTLKADLLEHNNVIKVHATGEDTRENNKEKYSPYADENIKRVDEMERIAANTASIAAAVKKPAQELISPVAQAMSDNVKQVFDIQRQYVALAMEGWGKLLGINTSFIK